MSTEAGGTRVFRQLLLLLIALGVFATAIDLLLIEHHADVWQLTPIVLLGATLACAAWSALAPSRVALRVFRTLMLLLVAGGAAGLWLHLAGNLEFEREVSPGLAGGELFWKAIKGASPPSLAPAGLIHLGLLGLLFTYRHPALDRSTQSVLMQGAQR
jgi:hypothetical protein